MKKSKSIDRRSALKGVGALGAVSLIDSQHAADEHSHHSGCTCGSEVRKKIFDKVNNTVFIDTHEHIIDEDGRFPGSLNEKYKGRDWSFVFSGYLASDMTSAGMSKEDRNYFFSKDIDPMDKWRYLEPHWDAIRNTGYGQAVCIALKELYGVDELNARTVRDVQKGYEESLKPGFYKKVLYEMGKIESCQVNSLEGVPFKESNMPTFLMQDLSILGMAAGPNFKEVGEPTGIEVKSLADWHKVIEWWFNKYQKYAVAVKSQQAYMRDIDFMKVPAEKVEGIFRKKLQEDPLSPEEQKAMEDHLFWYAVDEATKAGLPVKLHTGYYAGENRMPLSRLINNAASATHLCRTSPETTFVFMHICYPYYEELISVAKQYTNAYVDMCWGWIINPVAAKDFLKKYLVTAPANKILTFGGDYLAIEPVLGHAFIARRGIALALSELVEEGWYTMDDALAATDIIMHENARKIFKLEEKEKNLSSVPWKS